MQNFKNIFHTFPRILRIFPLKNLINLISIRPSLYLQITQKYSKCFLKSHTRTFKIKAKSVYLNNNFLQDKYLSLCYRYAISL